MQIYWCLWGLIQNGPVRPTVANNNHNSSEKVIDSTYSITVGVDTLRLEENAIREEEEEITSSDDDFDYLKYAQQKSGLTIGDLLQFDLINKEDIPEEHVKDIKHLDCDFFDL